MRASIPLHDVITARRLAGTLAAVLLCAGCARPAPVDGAARPERQKVAPAVAAATPIPLVVRNDFPEDLTIFVVRGGVRLRLGTVTPLTSRTFQISGSFAADQGGFQLVANPLGGPNAREAYTSEQVVVQSGQKLVWTLASDLSRSFLAVQ